MTRRKLKDAIANNEELSFVFGNATVQKIVQAVQDVSEKTIPLQDILCSFTFVPDSKPVRHYYDMDDLNRWALNDIKPNGICSPLWIRPHPYQKSKYELVAGLRRYKAAEILELENVPVKVFDWDDRTAFQAAVSENSNRRDFSALEELDNTLRMIEIHLGCDTEEVVSLLYRMNNAAKGTTNQNVLVSEEAEVVKQIFDSFSRITWQSFVSTRLPLLKKPSEVLDAIRHGKIHYTKGILLASIKDGDVRQKLLEEAAQDALSLSEIKQRIKATQNEGRQSVATMDLKQRLALTVQQAKSNKKLWRDPNKTQQIERLLEQLEAIIVQ